LALLIKSYKLFKYFIPLITRKNFMPTKIAAVPAAKKAPMRAPAQAKQAVRRRAVRKSSRPAGDMRVTVADIAPAKKTLKAAAAKQAPAAAMVADPAANAAAEVEKEKVVRDGFTMPRADYEKFKTLKAVCLSGGVAVKKSELLRAGLHALEALAMPDLLARIQALPPIKAGRKKK
jgi:hypothetical protein